MKRWLKRISLTLLTLVLVLVLAVLAMLYSQTGSRWLLRWIPEQVPGLEWRSVHGALATEIRFQELNYQNARGRLDVSMVEVQLDWMALLQGRVRLNSLTLDRLEWQILPPAATAKPATVAGFTLPVSLAIEQFVIRQVQIPVQIDKTLVDVHGQLRSTGNHEVDLKADVTHPAMGEITLQTRLDTRNLSLTGQINGQVAIPTQTESLHSRFDATIAADAKQIELTADVQVHQENWSSDAHLSANWQPPTNEFTLTLTDGALDGTILPDVLPSGVAWQAMVSGPWDRPQFSGSAQAALDARSARGYQQMVTTFSGQLQDNITATLQQLDVRLDQAGHSAFLRSSVELSWQQGLDISGESRMDGFNPGQFPLLQQWIADAALAPHWINGQIDATTQWRIRQPENDADWAYEISSFDLDGVLAERPITWQMQAAAKLGGLPQQLDATLEWGGDRVQVQTLPQRRQLQARLTLDQLGTYMTLAQGAVNGELIWQTDSNRWTANLNCQQCKLQEWTVRQATLNASGLAQSGLPDLEARLEANQVTSKQLQIQQMSATIDETAPTSRYAVTIQHESAEVIAEAAGTREGLQFAGMLSDFRVSPHAAEGQWSLWQPVALAWPDHNVLTGPLCLQHSQSSAHGCLKTELSRNGQPVMALSTQAVPLAWLNPWLPPALMLAGDVKADVGLIWTNTGIPQGNARIVANKASVRLRRGDKVITKPIQTATTHWTMGPDALTGQLRLELGEGDYLQGELVADLSAAQPQWKNSSLEWMFRDTAWLAALSPEISNMEGTFFGDASLSGDWRQPSISAQSQLQGSATIPRANIAITNPQMAIELSKNGALKLQGEAQSGEGSIIFSGDGRYQYPEGFAIQGRLQGKQVEVLRHAELQLAVSPDVNVEVDGKQVSLSGVVLVDSATIAFEQIPQAAQAPSADIVIVGDDASTTPENPWPLDYRITVALAEQNPVKFNALGLDATIDGAVLLMAGKDQPMQAFGQLRTLEGKYSAYGQELAVDSGNLIFDGDISNPELFLKATRTDTSGAYTVTLQVGGTAANLNSVVTADPELPEVEALSILLTGRRQLSGDMNESELMGLVLSLGLQSSASTWSTVQSAVGLDVLTLKGCGSQQGCALEAGQYLNDDLYLGYRYGIFDRQGVLQLRYQISRRLLLESAYGDAQAIDLLYQFSED